ncbi:MULTISPECIES: hypothetical protein [unclassified Paenibacillus]|uniref:hypothetical protein n=1 Tax=unclassified Paenibacillus TaxID=185978 RepID=UPI001AE1245E|nr:MULTISPECIES: hypothetical protein [unclassified Paenibacillus]MBP1157368.1 hypothetical protein [Paenibacillus sp. PvP091]MBP1171894.1 hypothetical protein [Paenibacillus sp. PvR098]MBP2438275.1 hypothetical protein [Paenibacillus sp. PvP052]
MSDTHIPNGERKVTLTLSLKEAMALAAGVRFHQQPSIEAEARRKVLATLERELLPETNKLYYHQLEA